MAAKRLRYGQADDTLNGKPPLRAGMKVRFEPGGTLYEIVRTTPGAAYRRTTAQRKVITTDPTTGKTSESQQGSNSIEAVSLYSYIHEVVEG